MDAPKRFRLLLAVLTTIVLLTAAALALTNLTTPRIILSGAKVHTPQIDSPEDKLSTMFDLIPQESAAATAGRININTADKEALLSLPDIDDVLAQRIIKYRTYNGAFASVEDLTNVTGLGAATLNKIRDLITI